MRKLLRPLLLLTVVLLVPVLPLLFVNEAADCGPIEELRPTIDPQLARSIMRCLSADQGGRPKSMDHFLLMIRDVEHEDVGE